MNCTGKKSLHTACRKTEPRSARFQIMISDSLRILLQLRALQTGISQNELVNQALINELMKDPNH
jgi:predicted HicB family RNase H-like nuclease